MASIYQRVLLTGNIMFMLLTSYRIQRHLCRLLSKLLTGTTSCDVSIVIASYSALILTPPLGNNFQVVFLPSFWCFRPVLSLAFWPLLFRLLSFRSGFRRVFSVSSCPVVFSPSLLSCLRTSVRCSTNKGVMNPEDTTTLVWIELLLENNRQVPRPALLTITVIRQE